MSRRRLRIAAAGALLALAAPLFAAQPQSTSLAQSTAQIRTQAHEFGRTVKQNSTQFGHQVAIGAREAGRQFNTGMHQLNRSMHEWWQSMRAGAARAHTAADEHLHSI